MLKTGETNYYHVEVVAAVPSRTASRAGQELIKSVGMFLADHAKFVTASLITNVGFRLCKYFDFAHAADEKVGGKSYAVYVLTVDREKLSRKVARF